MNESRQAVGFLERRLRLSGREEAAEVLCFIASTGGAGLGRRELSRLLLKVLDALRPALIRRLHAHELAALHRFNNGVHEWIAASPPPVSTIESRSVSTSVVPIRKNAVQRSGTARPTRTSPRLILN